MNAPTREEFDAKLEVLMVRMDGRVASIEAKIDGLSSAMNERFGGIDVRFRAMDERFKSMDDRIGRMETATRETQASIGGLRTTMLVTGLSAVIAIVLGVAAFNATLLSNMMAAFESGRNLGADQAELKRQIEATAVLVKQLQAQRPPSTTPGK